MKRKKVVVDAPDELRCSVCLDPQVQAGGAALVICPRCVGRSMQMDKPDRIRLHESLTARGTRDDADFYRETFIGYAPRGEPAEDGNQGRRLL